MNDIAAEKRRIALEGTPNFRDFGGYETRDGRVVRWGQLYRSGSLSKLNDADLDKTGAARHSYDLRFSPRRRT
jgi:protein-tyrosine phosphatase